MIIPERSLKNGERAVFRLRELYGQYGYTYYKMSKFEEYDLYVRSKSFLPSEYIPTFTDTDGKLMALKPDVTLSIVKNAQAGGGALEKVYYNENVYRADSGSHGYREIMQAGLECIGQIDLHAMAEVALLAVKSLEAVGGGDCLLNLSHLGVVTGLLEAAGASEPACAALLTAIGEKNAPAIAALCGQWGIEEEYQERLCRIALLRGGPEEVLPPLRAIAANETMAAGLQELTDICGLLGPLARHVCIDLSMVDDARYYSGLILRGFLPGLPRAVLSGGRYANLLRQMGKDGGAVGFAVYLNLLERYSLEETGCDVDVLLLRGPSASPRRAMAEAEALRAQGLSVRVERAVPKGLKAREIREVV